MKKLLLLCSILVFAVVCSAQDGHSTSDIPDFSGSWVLDKQKSGPESGFIIRAILADISMEIEQKGFEIRIKRITKSNDGREGVENITYFSDGRRLGVRKKNDKNNYQTVEWKGRKLVRKVRFMIEKGEGWDWLLDKNGKKSLKMKNKEEWKISKDGKTLTQKTSGGTAPGVPFPSAFKYVFRRNS